MKPIILCLATLALIAGGCASNTLSKDAGPTPAQVVASGEARSAVHWGGQIVMVKNLRDRTLVEVLAFPLDGNGRPRLDRPPEGRFIVERPGFLEPHDYASNRLLEVRGQLNGFTSGSVGEAPYRYPVVMGDQLILWPEPAMTSSRPATPRINFGFGVSNHGGGAGVGIGF